MNFNPRTLLLFAVAALGTIAKTEYNVYDSRTNWPLKFKEEFVAGCIKTGGERTYCDCMSTLVEKKGLVAAKYNTWFDSEEKSAIRGVRSIEEYFKSDQGILEASKCVTQGKDDWVDFK